MIGQRHQTNRAITHYVGAALLLDILCVAWLIHETLAYEGNDIAQAAVLIGGPISVATLLVGVISGIALGKHMAQEQQAKEDDQ
jgi:uncharacterized membrane protein YccF (DUF307 family)